MKIFGEGEYHSLEHGQRRIRCQAKGVSAWAVCPVFSGGISGSHIGQAFGLTELKLKQ